MMPEKENIYSLDLLYNGIPMPFVIKTMEAIDEQPGGVRFLTVKLRVKLRATPC
jgi:hypothetical protein